MLRHLKALVLPLAFTFGPVNGFGSCDNPKVESGRVGQPEASQAQLSKSFPQEPGCRLPRTPDAWEPQGFSD